VAPVLKYHPLVWGNGGLEREVVFHQGDNKMKLKLSNLPGSGLKQTWSLSQEGDYCISVIYL